MRFRSVSLKILLLLTTAAFVACSGRSQVTGVETTGGEPAGGPATEIIKFDPNALAVDAGQAIPAVCAASTAVGGAYRCARDGADSADPCFARTDGLLVCAPNPVSGSYALLVTVGEALSAAAQASDEPFFIQLEGSVPSCSAHTGSEPVVIAGGVAQYDCAAPYTYVLGFEKSTPVWEAAVFSLDPSTGASSGIIPTNVVRAWVP